MADCLVYSRSIRAALQLYVRALLEKSRVYECLLIVKRSWPRGFSWYCLSMAALPNEHTCTHTEMSPPFRGMYIVPKQNTMIEIMHINSLKPVVNMHI